MFDAVVATVDSRDAAIEGVVFDAVGTLLHPAQPIASTYLDFGRRFGSPLPRREIADRFRSAFQAACWEPATNAQYRRTWRQIVAAVFQPPTESVDELFESLWSYYGQPAAWSVDPCAGELLMAIHARGKRLAIASNCDDRLFDVCPSFPALAPCSTVLPATVLGAAKPNPLFFQAVSSRLGVPPERLLMVGDDPERDVAAARAAGWQAIMWSETPRWGKFQNPKSKFQRRSADRK